jgi:hypothetical protein
LYNYLLRNHFFTGSQSGYMYEILGSPSYDLVASGYRASAYVEPCISLFSLIILSIFPLKYTILVNILNRVPHVI